MIQHDGIGINQITSNWIWIKNDKSNIKCQKVNELWGQKVKMSYIQ